MFHISFESGVLEDPAATPPESTHKYTTPLAKCKETHDDVQVREKERDSPGFRVLTVAAVQIWFEKGDPIKVKNLNTGEEASTPANILKVPARPLSSVVLTGR